MPIYTYSCDICEINTAKMCKIEDRDVQACDYCEGKLKRGIDRPGGVYAPTSTGGGLKV